MNNVWLVGLAGGKGSRFCAHTPKQFYNVRGQPLFMYSLDVLCGLSFLKGGVVVIDSSHAPASVLNKFDLPLYAAKPGAYRASSLTNALTRLRETADVFDDDWIMIHDLARPNITSDMADEFFKQISGELYGGILAVPVASTIKRVERGYVVSTVNRQNAYLSQTPQMYRLGHLQHLLLESEAHFESLSDESILFEQAGLPVRVVIGSRYNVKITYQEDLLWFEKTLQTLP